MSRLEDLSIEFQSASIRKVWLKITLELIFQIFHIVIWTELKCVEPSDIRFTVIGILQKFLFRVRSLLIQFTSAMQNYRIFEIKNEY
jgi:hypothetical protein